MRASQAEVDNLSRELRYTQQTVAMELAGWQDMHEKMGRRAIRDLAKGMVVLEKMRLEGMGRALRKLRDIKVDRTGAETCTGPSTGGGQRGVVSEVDGNAGAGIGAGEARGFSNLGAPIVMAGLEIQADRKAIADAQGEAGQTGQNSTTTQPVASSSRINAPLPALPTEGTAGSSQPPE